MIFKVQEWNLIGGDDGVEAPVVNVKSYVGTKKNMVLCQDFSLILKLFEAYGGYALVWSLQLI